VNSATYATIATLTSEKTAAEEALSNAQEELDGRIASLQTELDAEKASHDETTGKLTSKIEEHSKLVEEYQARGAESEGHSAKITELEAVSFFFQTVYSLCMP